MLRVATYNIQKSVGLDVRRRPDRILRVIADIDPDVLALQEVDRRFGSRRSTLPVDMIAAHTDLKVVPLASRPHSMGWHGNSILVRKSITVLGHRRLSLPQLEPRGAVQAMIDVDGDPLRIIATHLSLFGIVRKKQIAHLMDELQGGDVAMPTVVLGDLNEWNAASRRIRHAISDYAIAKTGRSFPAVMPVARLDRIITSPEVTVAAAGIHRSRPAMIASDHLPVWAELSIAGPTGQRQRAGAPPRTGTE